MPHPQTVGIDPLDQVLMQLNFLMTDLVQLLEEIGQPGLAYEAYLRVSAIHPHFDDVPAALERLKGVIKGSDL